MISKILQSNGVRQIFGACAGMAVAGGLYFVMNALPGAQIGKALLIGTSSNISTNADRVRVNEKSVTDGELARIADRAQQVAATMHAAAEQTAASSSSAPTVTAVVQNAATDHADRNAWIAMRASIREKNAINDAAASEQYAAAPSSAVMIAQRTPAAFPTINYVAPDHERVVKHLPSSGLGLDLLLAVSFALAVFSSPERRRGFIAALKLSH